MTQKHYMCHHLCHCETKHEKDNETCLGEVVEGWMWGGYGLENKFWFWVSALPLATQTKISFSSYQTPMTPQRINRFCRKRMQLLRIIWNAMRILLPHLTTFTTNSRRKNFPKEGPVCRLLWHLVVRLQTVTTWISLFSPSMCGRAYS